MVNTVATSQLHDPCVVPYFELTFRGTRLPKSITIPFDVERWKRQQENITANRGVPYYDTTNSSLLGVHS